MRVELRLRVIAGATPTRLTLTALVGKRSNGTSCRTSAYGYKPKFYGAHSTSGAGGGADVTRRIADIVSFGLVPRG